MLERGAKDGNDELMVRASQSHRVDDVKKTHALALFIAQGRSKGRNLAILS
jgi:hypothetical protein